LFLIAVRRFSATHRSSEILITPLWAIWGVAQYLPSFIVSNVLSNAETLQIIFPCFSSMATSGY